MEGVRGCREVHFWTLASKAGSEEGQDTFGSLHILLADSTNEQKILQQVSSLFVGRGVLPVNHLTIQLEKDSFVTQIPQQKLLYTFCQQPLPSSIVVDPSSASHGVPASAISESEHHHHHHHEGEGECEEDCDSDSSHDEEEHEHGHDHEHGEHEHEHHHHHEHEHKHQLDASHFLSSSSFSSESYADSHIVHA